MAESNVHVDGESPRRSGNITSENTAAGLLAENDRLKERLRLAQAQIKSLEAKLQAQSAAIKKQVEAFRNEMESKAAAWNFDRWLREESLKSEIQRLQNQTGESTKDIQTEALEKNTSEDLMRVFRAADKNGDGTVSPNDFKHIFKRLSWSEKDIGDLVTAFDKGGCGKLQYGEFIDWLLNGVRGSGTMGQTAADVPDLTDQATLLNMPLTVIIFGATGDLAQKKLFPALYQLCLLDHFPRKLNIVGYGRKPVDLPQFIEKQCANIKEDPRLSKSEFCARIAFHAGGYDVLESYEKLDATIAAYEAGKPGNRLFFLSVPPTIFGAVSEMISAKARAPKGGFTRLMIEKPFGRDSVTFKELDQLTAKHFNSTQLYRLDHYLGKEVILNISTLRWGNQAFEAIWSAQYIESVQIVFKEDLGTGGRGGYFDGFGIIRDIIQNHLLQAFMWLTMEPPASMTAGDIIKAKVDVLSKVDALSYDPSRVFLGQFTSNGNEKGYLDDETVPVGSTCPTFASIMLTVENSRWKGVPFLFTAGKGMDERVCEIRVRFKLQPTNRILGIDSHNELVLRVQPDESLYMITVAKVPGITAEQIRKPVVMDMNYRSQFEGAYLGDAYERMFLNTGRGDQALFVSAPELVEAWRIFTPMLHQIDEKKPKPVLHPFGVLPPGFLEWASSHGVTIKPTWHEYVAMNGKRIDDMKKVFLELDRDKKGWLDFKEVADLLKRFFDGRQPTEEKVRVLFTELDTNRDGKVTVNELIQHAQKMARAFEQADEPILASQCALDAPT